jgi:hypothetical protein
MEQKDLFNSELGTQNSEPQPVECLGMTFPNDEERRKYFIEKLSEKLKDSEFRKIEGFPIGSDEHFLSSLPSARSHTGEHECRQDHHEAVEITTWEYAYEN